MAQPLSINQRMADDMLRHRLRLVGHENGVAKAAGSIWTGIQSGAVQTAAIRWADVTGKQSAFALADEIADMIPLGVESLRNEFQPLFVDEVQMENRIMRSILIRNIPAAMWDAVGFKQLWERIELDQALGESIPQQTAFELSNSPINGKRWNDRLDTIAPKTRSKLRKQIALSVSRGESIQAVSARIRNVIGQEAKLRSTLIGRTEVHNVANRVHDKMFEANRDILSGVKYLATLDNRTCIICGSFDGNEYFFEPLPGQSSFGDRPFIPVHPRCRCVDVPLTRFQEVFGTAIKPEKRASAFGPIKSENYQQWLTRQSPGFIEDILGETRARLFINGEFTLKRFVNNGKIRTLEQIEAADKASAARAAIDPNMN